MARPDDPTFEDLASSTPRDPMSGVVLDGRYQLRERLGVGSMGIVYAATQLSVDRVVAIKVIRDSLLHDRGAIRRFLREAQLVSDINHPNVIHVFDYGETDAGAPFLVTELLTGRTLAHELARCRRLDPTRACDIAIQLCDALAAAHDAGVVHRDLKPANIMLLDAPAVRDLVKVLDFGLAKSLSVESSPAMTITEAGTLLGTPFYMAPEALGSTMPDPRSDLYSLGCIVYELVAGRPPFADATINMVLARHLSEAPPALPADVPRPLCDLILALLAKSPDARPASAISARAGFVMVRQSSRDMAELDPAAWPSSSDLDDVPTLLHQARGRIGRGQLAHGHGHVERATVARGRVARGSASPATTETDSTRRHLARAVPAIAVFVALCLLAALITLAIVQG